MAKGIHLVSTSKEQKTKGRQGGIHLIHLL